MECSYGGILVDEQSGYEVKSLGYGKFFHFGEVDTALQQQFRVFEHLDGMFACLYHYNGEWFVSSGCKCDVSADNH